KMSKVIIIGSGMGGLVAGNLLAKKGHKVTIFESHNMPGGYVAGFWKNGYYFESGTFSFEASYLVFKVMKDIGVFDKIDFVRQKIQFKSKDFDGVLENFRDFKNMLYEAYAQDKERLDRYFAEVGKMYEGMIPFIDQSGLLAKISGGFKTLMAYSKYKKTTISEFTAKFFSQDSELYRLLVGLGYPEMAAWILGGAMVSIFSDYWTVKGGMQSWADVLADNFKKSGGELKLNAYVDKIITKNGKATGVACKGNIFEADQVIAAGDYKQTFLKLLDNQALIADGMKKRIEQAAVSEGMVMVYLGLKISNEELSKHIKVYHAWYFDEKPGADRDNPNDESFFEKTSLSLYSPSLLNGKLAPEGKSSLMIAAVAPNGWMNNWGNGDKNKYRELKEKVKKTLMAKAAAIVPGLQDMIEYEDAATPLTYERYTHNTLGATSAWSWNPQKKFYKTIMGSQINTPVKNLYIGSCWASQIGGVPGAIAAALKCAKKIK
ncbi:MAG: NAD(P)/FAD-dependent oxidoreductase, partial [bacterium]